MSDLIDRQAAVDALENTKQNDPFDRYENQNIGIEWAIDALKALPSAQPEPCEDAVSRAELLSAFPYDDEPTVTKCSLRMTINHLPSVTPKQRTGKWIKTARWGRVYYCDQCRNYLDFDGVNAGRGSTNFCPNCGAKMEVTE